MGPGVGPDIICWSIFGSSGECPGTTPLRSHFGSSHLVELATGPSSRAGVRRLRAMARRLAEALNGIWMSEAPLTEKRRLSARVTMAVGMPGGGAEGSAQSYDVLSAFEECVCEVATKAGCARDVRATKQWLRQQGEKGVRLASRLGRLSKVRNAAAHPDATFLEDVRNLVSDGGSGKDYAAEDQVVQQGMDESSDNEGAGVANEGHEEEVEPCLDDLFFDVPVAAPISPIDALLLLEGNYIASLAVSDDGGCSEPTDIGEKCAEIGNMQEQLQTMDMQKLEAVPVRAKEEQSDTEDPWLSGECADPWPQQWQRKGKHKGGHFTNKGQLGSKEKLVAIEEETNVADMSLDQVQEAISACLAGEPPITAPEMQWYDDLMAREAELQG